LVDVAPRAHGEDRATPARNTTSDARTTAQTIEVMKAFLGGT
jgi:hypothetical protein